MTFNSWLVGWLFFQREIPPNHSWPKCNSHLEITIPKDLKLKEAEKADEKQLIIVSIQFDLLAKMYYTILFMHVVKE